MDQSSISSGSKPPLLLAKKSPSFFGPIKAVPSIKNIDKLQLKNTNHLLKEEERNYQPKVSENFLEDWLNYPVDKKFQVVYNSFNIWFVWMRWTSRGMASLDPQDSTIRARICNQQAILGNAAGLFLIMSVSGFLTKIKPLNPHDHYWVNIFGCIMFTASICLFMYITLSLTAIYPLVECLRDDVAFEAYEQFQRKVGGKVSWLFLMGIQLVLVGLLVVARVNYHDFTLYYMFLATVLVCGCVQFLGREVFLALDPISAMHMGLSNDPQDHSRAESLSHYLLRKIPNTLMSVAGGREVFGEKQESAKLQQTRRIIALSASAPHTLNSQGHKLMNSSATGPESDPGVGWSRCAVEGHGKPAPVGFNRLDPVMPAALPPLDELFCSPDKYHFHGVGLSLEASVAAYHRVTQAGCRSTEQLLGFMKEAKQYVPCTCSRHSSADAGSVLHADHCASRSPGAWAEALTIVGVPYAHALLVVRALRVHLC